MTFEFNQITGLLPEIVLLISACGLLMYEVFKNSLSYTKKDVKIQNYDLISTESALYNIEKICKSILYLILFILFIQYKITIEPTYYAFGYFVNDRLIITVKIVILLSSIITILISEKYVIRKCINNIEYYALILLSIIGMFTLVSSTNLIGLYLSIELQSLCFYTLATFLRKTEASTEAGLKYFVLGALSSGILLFGFSLLYGITGTTSFKELAIILSNFNLTLESLNIYKGSIISGIILIVASLLFKLGSAPFHMWVPDVYEGSPTSITAFFAIVPKIGILTVLIKFCIIDLAPTVYYWQYVLIISSVLSIIIGTFGAFYQKKLKRLFAYAAISHVGYMLIGLINCNEKGLQSVFFYILVYIILNILLFSFILQLQKVKITVRGEKIISHIEDINELKGLYSYSPNLAFYFSITLFSMAGIPPLAGFWSKMYLFMSAIDSSMYLLPIIAVLTSVVSCFYYIRIIKLMFFDRTIKKINFITNIDRGINVQILKYLTIVNISFMLFCNPILTFIGNLLT